MPEDSRRFTSHDYIKIDGTNLPPDTMAKVAEVVVEQSTQLPSMFSVRLIDEGNPSDATHASFLGLLSGATFGVGKAVEIAMGREETPATLFKGEITAIELDASPEKGPELIVRGFDKGHRLHRGRNTRSFLDQKDSDVASTLAQEASLSAQVDATSVSHEYLFQNNQTNWEFLRDRASRIGYELWVDDTTLHFRKPTPGATVSLKLWEDLLHLRARASSAYQPESVTVKGWDQKAKAAITGGPKSSGQLAPGVQIASQRATEATTFGQSKVFVVNRIVDNTAEADAVAQGIFESLDAAYIQLEEKCIGNPRIKPGVKVGIQNVGSKLNGEYYVTSTVHTRTRQEGYRTTFVVSGLQSNSLLDMLKSKSDGASSLIPNVVVGIVTNLADPDKKGRVKVKFPWMPSSSSGGDQESWWARVASPMAGKERGFYFLPEIDDEVLVAFEHGDPSRPYILGGLWNGQDAPPEPSDKAVGSGKVNHRMIKTRQGHIILLDDEDGKMKFSVKTKAGHELLIDDEEKQQLSLSDKDGKNLLKMELQSGKITILADKDIYIEAKNATLNLKSKGELTVKTENKATVEAAQDVTVKTKANAKVEAQGNVEVKATGNAKMEATGNLELKGMQVTINGTASVEVKNAAASIKLNGPIVNINNGALEVM